MELRPVSFKEIQRHFLDFQKHSHCYEMVNDTNNWAGIFQKGKLIGYFVIQTYQDKTLDIIQGYLIPEARHLGKPTEAMKLLEHSAKKAGITKIRLQTNNRFKAYLKFAKGLGYTPTRLEFCKEVK